MKFIISLAVVAILGCCGLIEAFPQRATVQRVPYHPPPTPPPRPIRMRRQVLSGQASSNPAGGADARLEIARGIGNPEHNVIASAFAEGNTNRGPVTTGGTLAYNNNGHGVALTKEHIPGVRDTFKQEAHVNLFPGDTNKLDAKVFASQNTLANGFKYERNGGGLEWNHANGHSANAVLSNVPGIGKQFDFGGRANLWQSQDQNTRLDLTAGGSKWLSGPFSDQKTNFGGGLGLTHIFH